jgi:predicted DNA-binding transcriptional regulator YafY
MATLPRPLPVQVLLHTDRASAEREVGKYIGPLAEAEGGVRLATSTTSYTWFARMLASLNFDFTIEGPEELRAAVRLEAQRLTRLAS